MGRTGRWAFPAILSWCLFVNHYSRDVTGALEEEIEEVMQINKAQYALLNSIYFLPNIIMPLIAGALAQRFDGLRVMSAAVGLSAVGHLLVGAGCSSRKYAYMLAGRAVLGFCYETIDMMPLPILGAAYSNIWAFLVGFINAFIRMGSVTNFVLSPVLYHGFGLDAAMWAASLLGVSALGAVVGMWRLKHQASPSVQVQASSCGDTDTTMLDAAEDQSERFHVSFWIFLCTGMLMYSAIVPFWLSGSRIIQEMFGYSLQAADALLIIPEGMISILSPVIGMLVDRQDWSLSKRLTGLSLSLLCFPISYALLLCAWIGATAPVLVLGAGWAWSNCLFWSVTTQIMPHSLLGLGSGLIGSALNVGAAVLPYMMGLSSDTTSLLLLIASSSAAAASAYVTRLMVLHRRQ